MKKMIGSSKPVKPRRQALPAGSSPLPVRPDSYVLVPALLLLAIGVVMVGSASIAIAEGQGASSHHYLLRHLIYIALGAALAQRTIAARGEEWAGTTGLRLALAAALAALATSGEMDLPALHAFIDELQLELSNLHRQIASVWFLQDAGK